jgi:hypothetical protein
MRTKPSNISDHEWMDQLQAERLILQQQFRILQAISEGKKVDMTGFKADMDRSATAKTLREVNQTITKLYNSMYDENSIPREKKIAWGRDSES